MNLIEEWSFILPILRCSCPGGTPCVSHQAAEEISKRAATVAAGQPKHCPEKFLHKVKKTSENSLKIETPGQSL
jgi:hypothetical protein